MVLNKGDTMARQSKGIKVNVSRLKVIEALEKSLTKLETDYQIGKKLDADYEKQKSDWHNKVLKLTLPLINKAENVRVNVRYNGSINVDFDLPAGVVNLPEEPVRNYEQSQIGNTKTAKKR
jgi:hypothetical protein